MRYLQSGTGRQISRIGLGTWQFGSREWGYGDDYVAVTTRLVERALDLGITLFDTAEAYGFGRSERLLGAALRTAAEDDPTRPQPFVATKLFPMMPVAPVVEQRAVASAARLGVQTIDLYQVHQPNPVVRDGATMRGMRALHQVGLVGAVGVSNYSLERWRDAEDAYGSPVLSNQVQYSIAHRGPEEDLLPYAAEKDRIVIAYSPLAQGFVSGRYRADNPPGGAIRRANPLFLPESLDRANELFGVLREVGDAHGVGPSQAALAYVLHHPRVVAIPGASSVEQVESNAAAADIELAEDEFAALRGAAIRFEPVHGWRAVAGMVRRR